MTETANEYSTSMIIQYTVVALVLLAACVWIGWKVFKKQKNPSSSCCGCAIADSCSKKNLISPESKSNCNPPDKPPHPKKP